MSDNTLLIAAGVGAVAWFLHRHGSAVPHPHAGPAIATSQGSVGPTVAQTASQGTPLTTPILPASHVAPGAVNYSSASNTPATAYVAPIPPPIAVDTNPLNLVGAQYTVAGSYFRAADVNTYINDANSLGANISNNINIDPVTGFINGMNPWVYCMIQVITADQARYQIRAPASAIANQAQQLWSKYGSGGDSIISGWQKAYTVPIY